MRPWSQTMVSEGARPQGRGRSEFAKIEYPVGLYSVSAYRSIQNYYPRNFIFSELIRRGVLYYAGNFYPNYYFLN